MAPARHELEALPRRTPIALIEIEIAPMNCAWCGIISCDRNINRYRMLAIYSRIVSVVLDPDRLTIVSSEPSGLIASLVSSFCFNDFKLERHCEIRSDLFFRVVSFDGPFAFALRFLRDFTGVEEGVISMLGMMVDSADVERFGPITGETDAPLIMDVIDIGS